MDILCQSLHPIKKKPHSKDDSDNVTLYLPPLKTYLNLAPTLRLDKEYLSLVSDGTINLDVYNVKRCPKPDKSCPVCQRRECIIPHYFKRC